VAATGQGYGGLITAVVGFNPEGKIAGVRFVDLPGETVGLGSRVAEPAFAGQFAGKPAVALALSAGPPGAGEVQAITGATRSSRGALEAVNNAIAVYGRLGH
jgi:electron transport complex protein RnfG